MTANLDLSFWSVLLTALTLQTLCVVLVTATACLLVQSAQWRRLLWQVCLIALVTVTAAEFTGLGRGLTEWAVSQMPFSPEAALAEAAAAQSEATVTTSLTPAVASTITENPPPPEPRDALWPAVVWLAGSVLILFRVTIAHLLCLRIRLRNNAAPAGVSGDVASLAGSLGVKHRIHVLESVGLAGPMVFGLFKPTIVVPDTFESDFEPPQRRAMLAHELAHLTNRDPLWHRLGDVTAALLWWNPLVWWARHQLCVASERCADEASAVTPGGPEALAESLVRLGAQLTRRKPFAGLGVNGDGFRSSLGKRVERLLSEKKCDWNPIGWRRRLAAGCAGGVAVLGVTFWGALLARAEAAPSEARSLADSIHASWLHSPSALLASSAASDGSAPNAEASDKPEGAFEREHRQIMVEARFIEVSQSRSLLNLLLASGSDWEIQETDTKLTGDFGPLPSEITNAATHKLTGVVAAADFQTLLRQVREMPGSDVLSAPRLTVLSGRQGAILVGQVEEGVPVGVELTFVPAINSDERTIRLTLSASVTEHLQGEDTADVSSPRFKVRQVNMKDFEALPGETVVLGAFTEEPKNQDGARKDLFIFLTPTLVESGKTSSRGEGIVPAILIPDEPSR